MINSWLLRLLAAVTALMAALSILTGCGSLPASLYRTYSIKHGDVAFSFQYPTYYRLIHTYTRSDPNASVEVMFARTKLVRGYSDNYLDVSAGSPLAAERRPMVVINQLLSDAMHRTELERYSTSVAGIPAELVAYSYTSNSGVLMVTRAVYFNQNIRLWRIELGSDETGADVAKLDFQHVVETFKILP